MSSELVCGTYKDSVLQHVRWDSTDYIFALLGCLAAQFLTNVRGAKNYEELILNVCTQNDKRLNGLSILSQEL